MQLIRLTMHKTNRRGFLAKAGGSLVAAGQLLANTNVVNGSEGEEVRGRFLSHRGDPIPNAKIAVPGPEFRYVQTDAAGRFEFRFPAGRTLSLGFYKSSQDSLHARRIDGVPHVYALDQITVPTGGFDYGTITLPQAYRLRTRAVLGERKGVEDARPGFASVNDNVWFGSSPHLLTTNSEGYMKIKNADFTGVEMTGQVLTGMRPPEDDPRFNDEKQQSELEVTEDVKISFDLSRGETRGRKP